MEQPQWVKVSVGLGEKYSFKNQNPYIHNLCNIFLFLSSWCVIWVAWSLNVWIPSWAYIPFGSLIIGFLFYCQIVLVVHEAAHRNFIVSKNPQRALRWNRIFGWFVTIPFGIHFSRHWEKSHIIHHKFPLEYRDSENCNVRTGKELVKRLALILFIPGYVQLWGGVTGKGSEFDCAHVGEKSGIKINWWGMLAVSLFWGLVILIICFLPKWEFLKFFLATFLAIQVMAVLNVSRQALEHGGAIGNETNPLLRSRTTLSPIRYLLAPFNLCYHFEHHLNPSVPWYALKKYSKDLLKIVPQQIQPSIYNKNQVWPQLMGDLPSFPDSTRVVIQG